MEKEKKVREALSLERALMERLSQSEIRNWLKKYAMPYQELMSCYRCALMEVETKFNVLDEELSLLYDRNPIESIKSRIKSPESIEKNLRDIAGLRVICAFPSDIYMLADALLRQDDVTLIERKDYIQNPKDNGYRSLHLIIEIPIFLHNQTRRMKVEVQLRTIAMDWWASLEHKIRYKKDLTNDEAIFAELRECAEVSARLDQRMQGIHEKSENGKNSVL